MPFVGWQHTDAQMTDDPRKTIAAQLVYIVKIKMASMEAPNG